MSTVAEIETALEKLTPAQMQEVADWLHARHIKETCAIDLASSANQ